MLVDGFERQLVNGDLRALLFLNISILFHKIFHALRVAMEHRLLHAREVDLLGLFLAVGIALVRAIFARHFVVSLTLKIIREIFVQVLECLASGALGGALVWTKTQANHHSKWDKRQVPPTLRA